MKQDFTHTSSIKLFWICNWFFSLISGLPILPAAAWKINMLCLFNFWEPLDLCHLWFCRMWKVSCWIQPCSYLIKFKNIEQKYLLRRYMLFSSPFKLCMPGQPFGDPTFFRQMCTIKGVRSPKRCSLPNACNCQLSSIHVSSDCRRFSGWVFSSELGGWTMVSDMWADWSNRKTPSLNQSLYRYLYLVTL